MPRLRKPSTELDPEAGLTLTELIVAMTMMVAITAGAMAMLISSFKREPEVRGRANQIGDARVAMEKMVRELRQGTAIDAGASNENEVAFDTYVNVADCTSSPSPSTPVILCRVTYKCPPGMDECIRKQTPVTGGGGREETLLTGVSDVDFEYLPDDAEPTFVNIKLVYETPDGRSTTTLEDGATLRSVGVEGLPKS